MEPSPSRFYCSGKAKFVTDERVCLRRNVLIINLFASKASRTSSGLSRILGGRVTRKETPFRQGRLANTKMSLIWKDMD